MKYRYHNITIYEKWGTINMYPMYPIGVHSGVQSGVQSGVDLKSYCMTYMIIHMNKGLDRKLYTSCICSIYEKWGTIKHVPHVPHWGTLWGTKWGTISKVKNINEQLTHWKFLKYRYHNISIYKKWGKIKHIPHLPHWGK